MYSTVRLYCVLLVFIFLGHESIFIIAFLRDFCCIFQNYKYALKDSVNTDKNYFFVFIYRRHNDLPWNIRKFVHNKLMYFNFSADLNTVEPWSKSNWSQTDLPRLRRGMVGAQVSTLIIRGLSQNQPPL